MYLKEGAAVLKNKIMEWVSVKDRLPEYKTHVFLWVGGSVNQAVKHFYTSKGRWLSMEEIVLPKYFEANFWMPLPEPPKQ